MVGCLAGRGHRTTGEEQGSSWRDLCPRGTGVHDAGEALGGLSGGPRVTVWTDASSCTEGSTEHSPPLPQPHPVPPADTPVATLTTAQICLAVPPAPHAPGTAPRLCHSLLSFPSGSLMSCVSLVSCPQHPAQGQDGVGAGGETSPSEGRWVHTPCPSCCSHGGCRGLCQHRGQ